MAATFEFKQDTGTQTGSPLHGTTRTAAVTDMNWKNSGVQTDAYSAFPITAGQDSYGNYHYGHFSGTFNQILNGKYSAHTAGTSPMGTGLTLKGGVTSSYLTPTTGAVSAFSTDFSSTVAIGSGLAVSFSLTDPADASPTATLTTGPGFSQYLGTQLQTASSAAAGDTPTITATLQYDEN
jgi:hypothetical protein